MKTLTNFFRDRPFFKRINHQIFLLVIITITIPLIAIAIITYIFSVQTTKQEFADSSNLILNNLSFNIDQYLHSIETGTLRAQMNSELQDALMNWPDKEHVHKQIQYEDAIEHFISTIETSIKDVDSVQIYIGSRVFYSSLISKRGETIKDIAEQEWYQKTLGKEGGIVLFGTHKPFHRKNATQSVISLARTINKSGTRSPLGVLLIDIRLDSIQEILQLSENRDRNYAILDPHGRVIYASDNAIMKPGELLNRYAISLKQSLNSDNGSYYAPIAGVDSFINYVTSAYSGWTVVQYTDKETVTASAHTLRTMILCLATGSIAAGFLFLFFLYKRVTKPVIQLSNQIRQIGKGNFHVQVHSDRQDEFGVLNNGIKKMVVDIQTYIEHVSVLKSQKERSHYNALKSQIQPHFLANALESIQMKAILSDQRDIAEMVGSLGQLFRIHTQSGKELVPLQEELRHIRLYIQVQQIRFGEKIQYTENLDPDSLSVYILHFSLQPLIENSIIHGLEPKADQGTVSLSTSITKNDLFIHIQDDGIGMTEKQLANLRKKLSDPVDKLDHEHIGIRNIHQQMQFYYGSQYGITIYSAPDRGTVICIRIPVHLNPDAIDWKQGGNNDGNK